MYPHFDVDSYPYYLPRSSVSHLASYRSPDKPRMPEPDVAAADLIAPQGLPRLPGYAWDFDRSDPEDCRFYVVEYDPLTDEAHRIAETIYQRLHGSPVPDDPIRRLERTVSEYGRRAAHSMRLRLGAGVTVSDERWISVYRNFALQHVLRVKPPHARPADVISMSAFKAARRAERAAASRVECAEIAAHIREGAGGQLEIAL